MNEVRYLTQQLADQVLRYPVEALPAAVSAKAIDCVLDNVASCLAGVSAPPVLAARQMALENFAKGGAPIWFTKQRLSVIGAAWCNAMAASALDFDDGHRLARGHPGSAIIPSVLAQASRDHYSTPQILAAIAIGYEVAVTTAAAQRYEQARTYQSGRWTGLGVVAACGRLAGLNSDQLANALAIAGVWAPNQQANGSSGYAHQTGNWAKEGIPISVVQALMAIDLARQGFTGPKDLLDHKSHYDYPAWMGEALTPVLILETYFKRYSCCRYIHPALEAYSDISRNVSIEPDSITRVEVSTFAWALRLTNKLSPNNLVEVQYSLPFCLAALILRGRKALSPITQDLLRDDRIPALAARIDLQVCPVIDGRFPGETQASLRVFLRSGEILANEGPIQPGDHSPEDVREKFQLLASGILPEDQYRMLLDAVDPDHCNLNKLQLILAQAN